MSLLSLAVYTTFALSRRTFSTPLVIRVMFCLLDVTLLQTARHM